MFKAWVILNEKDADFKRQKFLKTFPLGEAMSKRGCKKEGLMQYKWMEREMRTLSMEGFHFSSVMYIAIIPAGMQL